MIKVNTEEIQPYEIDHLQRLRALAPECMVLLKKNGDFPLHAAGRIALYGSGARRTIKGGTGSGDVNVRHYVTVEEGLKNAGFTVTTGSWLDSYDAAADAEKKKFLSRIRGEAEETGKSALLIGMGRVPDEPKADYPLSGDGEVCVYVLARNSGEGSDRPGGEGDFLLTADETRDILVCAEKYAKFMLVLNVGGPVDLSPVLDRVENILLLSQLGSVTGDAFADVLLGKANPSGKLTATWARLENYPDLGDFAQIDDTHYKEGIFVGYRWFDAARKETVFPFGYGLSYSEFEKRCTGFAVEDQTVRIQVEVKNTGSFSGKETAALYCSAPQGRLVKPVRELGAYAKTKELAPGESEILTLILPLENMASWDDENDCWVLEKGEYVFSLDREPAGIVSLDADVCSERFCRTADAPGFIDWQPGLRRDVPDGLAVIDVHLDHIGHCDSVRLDGEKLKSPDMSGFTDEELVLTCVGKHSPAQGIAAIIGSSASRVAGGAGESADVAEKKGFGRLIMADGPAGLRLAKEYVETDAGAESLDSNVLGWMMDLIPDMYRQLILTKFAENEKKAQASGKFYHYASAIPIGTALAQAWDPAVPEACGDLVGEEMERFGVNVWLAPALNIHRSPLCGRNFEYYSEDPLISGTTAAAVTRGVQKHDKCAVTIKHFACNNQETNRYGSNSVASRRAIREIYLKGFEICVKESAPKLLMTSYNLLNGVHTPNRKDLLTGILREEWGFMGVVMTDWSTTGSNWNLGKYGASSISGCIKAGNDLIMPGGAADVIGILDALKTGELSREELEKCAGRVLAMSRRLS